MTDSSKIMNSITKKIADVSIKEAATDIVTPYVPVPSSLLRPIATRPRFLMGTGPTNVSQRVSESICKPLMGLYMDETYKVHYTTIHSISYISFQFI